jgi:hypothetical protein
MGVAGVAVSDSRPQHRVHCSTNAASHSSCTASSSGTKRRASASPNGEPLHLDAVRPRSPELDPTRACQDAKPTLLSMQDAQDPEPPGRCRGRELGAALFGLFVVAAGCSKPNNEAAKPQVTEAAEPKVAQKPAPPPKEVPEDVVAFLKWTKQASEAIEKGPQATDTHPILGRITCSSPKESPDFGYCSSSVEGTPRYSGTWLKKDPKLWSVGIMRSPSVTWLDCSIFGASTIRKANLSRGLYYSCKYSDSTDLWLRHYVDPSSGGNSQVYVFSRDFPKEGPTTDLSPRATLHRDLTK